MTPLPILSAQDLTSDAEVRWCPGCGNFSILAQFKAALAAQGLPLDRVVVVSGVGCAARTPHYVGTRGFQTLPGRAFSVATGVKLADPGLQVWVVAGESDALGAGGHHLLQLLRRNVDVKVLLFNNQVGGMAGGHASATSRVGTRTHAAPAGVAETPLRPLTIALAAEATFVARSADVNVTHLTTVLQRAARHKGAAFVEVAQNCRVYNDDAWAFATDRGLRHDSVLNLEQGKAMSFGPHGEKGLTLAGVRPAIDSDPDGWLVHDETDPDPALALILSRLTAPDFPEAFGVLRAVRRPTWDELLARPPADPAKLGRGPADTWEAGAP